MSTSTSTASQVATTILRFNIQYASIAVLYYDYSLTWTREVQYFWARKPSVSTFLLVCCRYYLVANVVYALALADKLPVRVINSQDISELMNDSFEDISCNTGYQIASSFAVVGRAAILIIWGARTYAVFSQNRAILIFFLSLGILILVLAAIHVPYISCPAQQKQGPPSWSHSRAKIETITQTDSPNLTRVLAISMTAFEILSGALALIRLREHLKFERVEIEHKNGLLELVLEQGLLYVGLVLHVITCFQVDFAADEFTLKQTAGKLRFVSTISLTTVVFMFIPSFQGTILNRILSAFYMPVSGMMSARFLIHLRDWENYAIEGSEGLAHRPIRYRIPSPRRESLEDDTRDDGWIQSIKTDPLFRVSLDKTIQVSEDHTTVGLGP
ncbi:hypothetical protein CPB83DRAFT_895037 [Crepidotus variabilis]|uniref:DUF6533 domain-containing protein n=1 Tax=Crepidotus variabilis TaxID=179855 RepID=A0A9P6EEK2_9AGAR|nr:hypothetical protein CPB83DRAFT_895037 [Crepidotus variabilis]